MVCHFFQPCYFPPINFYHADVRMANRLPNRQDPKIAHIKIITKVWFTSLCRLWLRSVKSALIKALVLIISSALSTWFGSWTGKVSLVYNNFRRILLLPSLPSQLLDWILPTTAIILPFWKYLAINSPVWRHATQLMKSACCWASLPAKRLFTAIENLASETPFESDAFRRRV